MGTTLHILYLHVQEHTHQSPQILSTIRAQGLLLIFAILSFTAMNRTEANKQSLRLIIIGIDHPRVLHPQMLLLLQLIPIDGPYRKDVAAVRLFASPFTYQLRGPMDRHAVN